VVPQLQRVDEPDVYAADRHPAASGYHDTELPSPQCHHVFRAEHECKQVVINTRFGIVATNHHVYDDTQRHH